MFKQVTYICNTSWTPARQHWLLACHGKNVSSNTFDNTFPGFRWLSLRFQAAVQEFCTINYLLWFCKSSFLTVEIYPLNHAFDNATWLDIPRRCDIFPPFLVIFYELVFYLFIYVRRGIAPSHSPESTVQLTVLSVPFNWWM